jgi:hypothetical protein
VFNDKGAIGGSLDRGCGALGPEAVLRGTKCSFNGVFVELHQQCALVYCNKQENPTRLKIQPNLGSMATAQDPPLVADEEVQIPSSQIPKPHDLTHNTRLLMIETPHSAMYAQPSSFSEPWYLGLVRG